MFMHDAQVFRDFCRSIGVANIRYAQYTSTPCAFAWDCLSLWLLLLSLSPSFRQYEEKQLHSQQERAQKRLDFANQISRLQNQLVFERQRDTKGNHHEKDRRRRRKGGGQFIFSIPAFLQQM